MYYIDIYDKETGKTWHEDFNSYYFFRKRVIKLKHSKKLRMIARSLLENERY